MQRARAYRCCPRRARCRQPPPLSVVRSDGGQGRDDSEWAGLKLRRASGSTFDPKKGISLSSALNTRRMVRQPSSMASPMLVVLTSASVATQLSLHLCAVTAARSSTHTRRSG